MKAPSMRAGAEKPAFSVGSETPTTLPIEDPLFDVLRRRGYRGTPILVHRALAWEPVGRWTILGAILAALSFNALLVALAAPLAQAWRAALEFWLMPLAPSAQVELLARPMLPGWSVMLPELALGAGAPTGVQWLNTLLGAIVVLLVSLLLPPRARPFAYLLRLAALIQLSANLYFYLSPSLFPHTLRSHVTGLLSGAFLLMLLVPWIHALTYYPFDHRWSRKLGLTLLTLLFFAIYTPVSLALHSWLIHEVSLVAQPLLYLLFGYPVDIFLMVCLYGWGMSWKH